MATLMLLALFAGCAGPDTASTQGTGSTQDAGPSTSASSTGSENATPEADSTRGLAGGPLLVDATREWGLDFVHDSGDSGELLFPEMMGGGIAVFDADGDGDLDLYLLSGSPALGDSSSRSGVAASVNRLYLQADAGSFVDATEGSGLDDDGYGTGVAVGDFDNDGHRDVFVANIGSDRLFRGRGDGTFEDVTRRAGLDSSGDPNREWSTSAAFCDIDRDGDLDLYVVGYVIFDRGVSCTDTAGRPEYCGPDSFKDRFDTLWLNQSDGSFRDVSRAAGLETVTGAGLGVVCEDMDEDGWTDIYVANDGDPNQLWINQRDGTFVDDALILGTSVNAAGLYEAGMGVVAADFDNDADLDLFLTHLRDETNTFYRNLGVGMGFEDQTARVGLAWASTPYTGFGTAALDLDLDADLDLVIANGRVTRGEPLTDHLPGPWNPYAEPNLAYRNDGGAFSLWRTPVAALTDSIEVSRSLAVGDLDGDGDLDIVLGNIESAARLLRAQPPPGGWLMVDAVDPRLRRRALGARIRATLAGGAPQIRTVQGAMSYLSSSDPRAHFGFGPHAKGPVELAVRWPDGLEERFPGIALNQVVVLERGQGES